jgi:DNA-binding MarR family transcriptional regulator
LYYGELTTGCDDVAGYHKTTDEFVDLDLRRLSGGEYKVLTVLKRYRNRKTGECHPAESTIAEKAGMSERGVRNAVKGLKDKGFVAIRTEKRKSGGFLNHYYLEA